jgi:YggT family protein
MFALFWLIDSSLRLFIWALIIGAIVLLLISFNLLETRNGAVWAIGEHAAVPGLYFFDRG